MFVIIGSLLERIGGLLQSNNVSMSN